MRISDWSSDVCSSDLGPGGVRRSSSGRLLTEPASRRHHGGARTFMRTAALVAFLVALLVGTLLAGIYLWWSLSDVEISIHGLIAMTLGCLVTLALGGGLMFLVFYSNRQGHADTQHGGPPS